ncbi:MAG: biopolymer transporter ExbD [Planctomycetota bacterium]
MRRGAILRGEGSSEPARVNVTPLIDVVMVLIVFFLLVGNMAAERNEPVPLPRAATPAEEASGDPIIINVLAGEQERPGQTRLMIAGRAVALSDLSGLITGEHAIRVRADRTLPYEAVEPVLAAAQAGGAPSVELAVELAVEPGGTP